MTRPALAVRFEIVAANIESRQKSPELLALIRQGEPDIVIVEQAYRAREWLRGIEGYKHRQYQGVEASGIAVLVRHGVPIRRRRALRMKREWIGPKADKKHPPRVYPALVLSKDDATLRVIGTHLPSHNNPAAQRESLDAIADYFHDHPNSALIAAGDWNLRAEELEGMAGECDADLLTAGTKVDHALTRGAEAASSRRLPTPEGAHGWARYAVEVTP